MAHRLVSPKVVPGGGGSPTAVGRAGDYAAPDTKAMAAPAPSASAAASGAGGAARRRPAGRTSKRKGGRMTLERRVKGCCSPCCVTFLYGSRETGSKGLATRLRQPATAAVLLVVVGCAVLTVYLANQSALAEEEAALTNRKLAAGQRVDRLADALNSFERGLSLLGAAAEALTSAAGTSAAGGEWGAFVNRGFTIVSAKYLEATASTLGVGVMDRVPRGLRGEYEANATRDFPERALPALQDGEGPPQVVIYALDAATRLPVRAPNRQYTYPLTFSSDASSASSFYLDLVTVLEWFGQDIRQGVERCATTGDIVATVFAGSGYLLFARARPPLQLADGEEPGHGSEGVGSLVVTGASAEHLVGLLHGSSPSDTTDIIGHPLLVEIDDVTPGERVINVARQAVGDTTLDVVDAQWRATTLLATDELDFASRVWLVRISEERLPDADDALDAVVLAAGLSATLFLMLLLCLFIEASDRRTRQRQQKMRAQIAQQTHARLVSYICHELRNPLHHISGGLALFMDDHAPIISSRMFEELIMLQQSVAQMVHVVNDILDIRKLEAGDIEVEIIGANVHSVVRDLAHQLRDSVRPDVTLSTVVSRSLPETLMIDPMRMRQVLGNAVHNACKFTTSGQIVIIVNTICDNRALLLEVRNTGTGLGGLDGDELLGKATGDDDDDDTTPSPGWRAKGGRESWASSSGDASLSKSTHAGLELPPKARQEVEAWFKMSVERDVAGHPTGPDLPHGLLHKFSSFAIERRHESGDVHSWQSPTAQSRSTPKSKDLDSAAPSQALMTNASGFGLGLPLCRRVTEHMGGEIGLQDEVGFTRFWVVLPVSTPTAEPVDASTEDDRAAAAAAGEFKVPRVDTQIDIADRYVIAIDDERVLRKLLQRYLDALRVESKVLDDGGDLPAELERCQREGKEVCCVLMDIVMLRSDGVNVCRSLRASGVDVPVYAMTGNVDRSHTETYKAAGFDGMLSKPFSTDGIRTCIMHALTSRGSWIQARSQTPTANVMRLPHAKQHLPTLATVQPSPAGSHAGHFKDDDVRPAPLALPTDSDGHIDITVSRRESGGMGSLPLGSPGSSGVGSVGVPARADAAGGAGGAGGGRRSSPSATPSVRQSPAAAHLGPNGSPHGDLETPTGIRLGSSHRSVGERSYGMGSGDGSRDGSRDGSDEDDAHRSGSTHSVGSRTSRASRASRASKASRASRGEARRSAAPPGTIGDGDGDGSDGSVGYRARSLPPLASPPRMAAE